VQAEKAHPPAATPSQQTTGEAETIQEGTTATPWYWRVALFLWIASFIGLFIYELLTGIVKAW
jgi:hypothetical protein